MTNMFVCSYHCGRSYTEEALSKQPTIVVDGISRKWPRCVCGSIAFDVVSVDKTAAEKAELAKQGSAK